MSCQYVQIDQYNDTRDFNKSLARVWGPDNAVIAMRNPQCAPSYTLRTGILPLKHDLFQPIENTVNKDVWSPQTNQYRRDMLDSQLQNGWTVFQRRTFSKTPVLWMKEYIPPPEVLPEF
jgi:hypothetical protein